MSIDKMVAEAEKTIGWSDEGNTKRTPAHTWYNNKFGNPDPGKYAWDWCDGWITYIAYMSGNEQAVCFGKGWAYTVAHAEAFRTRGQWTAGASGIRRGDIIFFDWDGRDTISAIDHVGLVVAVKPDGTVETIEGNTEDMVRRRQRKAFEIAGYGRPKYATTTTPPPPTTPPTEAPVGGTVTFEKVYPGAPVSDSVRVVQRALNKFRPPVTVDGDFGPKTKAAYAAWQASLGYTGVDASGWPGYTSMSRLAARYGFTLVKATPGTTPTPSPTPKPPAPATGIAGYQTAPEPAHDYKRVTYGGKKVNERTADLLRLAASWAAVTITLTQGSYNSSVSASAGTHDGGGAVDINVGAWSSSKRAAVVQALRKAGFAAWLRTPSDGFAYHIHAIAIGDREASSGAKNQVQSYFNGRNGLANNRADSVERHWPNWADKYNQ